MLTEDRDDLVEKEIAIRITRRELVIGAAATAFVVASSCATFRRGSDLDAAVAELDTLLKQIGGEDNRTLVAIAEKISAQSHALLETQRDFTEDFNRKAADRSVNDESLVKLVNDYEADRLARRDTLLQTQDELHAAVPADAWRDVLEVLNRKSLALAPRRGMVG